MTSFRLAVVLTASLAAATGSAQQTLVCPTAPAGRPCDAFHFHVQLYRPDTKQFAEVFGGNRFATQAACERARELHVATNAKAVEYLRGIKKQYEADRVGPCHCDMTTEKGSPTFLTESQRDMHLRLVEEVRLRLRERLLDEKLTSDSEIVRALWNEPASTPQLSMPKFAPLPQTAPAPLLTAPEDLKATRTIDTSKPAVAALDLPLIDLSAPPAPPAPVVIAAAAPAEGEPTATVDPAATPAPLTQPPAAPPAEEVVVAVPVEAEPPVAAEAEIASTVPEDDLQSAQETAERFIRYEKDRITNIIRASSVIDDEAVKSKIFEASMQRIQLLSNLRLLIETSGMRSRLASAARDADDEADRLALIGRLFGDDIKPHWAPRDASEVIMELDPAIAAEPERALRDTTGRFDTAQKKRALYLVLTQTQPTEDQLLWLTSIVEGFLR